MIDEKKLIEAIVNTPSECLDSYSVSSVQQGIQYGCATRQNEIIDIINKQPKTDWIPCEERLPKALEDVLVWCEGIMLGGTSVGERCQTYGLGYCLKGKWVVTHTKYMKNDKVIAWQPLPQPYKKEGAN